MPIRVSDFFFVQIILVTCKIHSFSFSCLLKLATKRLEIKEQLCLLELDLHVIAGQPLFNLY